MRAQRWRKRLQSLKEQLASLNPLGKRERVAGPLSMVTLNPTVIRLSIFRDGKMDVESVKQVVINDMLTVPNKGITVLAADGDKERQAVDVSFYSIGREENLPLKEKLEAMSFIERAEWLPGDHLLS